MRDEVTPTTLSLQQRQNRLGWLFLAPCLALLFLVGLVPLLHTFWISFTDLRMGSGKAANFVGLRNYQQLLQHKPLWRATGTTLLFTGISVTLEILLGLAVALLINSRIPGRGLLRAAVLIPWALPTVVAAKMWNYMLVDTFGVINDLLFTKLHLLPYKVAWTAEPGLTFLSVIAIDVWKTTPFVALLLLAGLQMIPRQTYEAAAVDGASKWQQFCKVTLPLLKPTLLVVVIFRTLDALRIFDAIWVLTRGQIGTESLATYTYRQMIDFRKLGYGSAVSISIFAMIAALVCAYLLIARSTLEQEER